MHQIREMLTVGLGPLWPDAEEHRKVLGGLADASGTLEVGGV